MKQFLVFAGTTEGRLLADWASKASFHVTVCVATDYGRALLPTGKENIVVHTGRMDIGQMVQFMKNGNYAAVVDATHPYAVEVSKNIKEASKVSKIKYLRLLREESHVDGAVYVDSLLEAVHSAENGNILATTGSKDVLPYTHVEDFSSRVYIRVLPMQEATGKCEECGFAKDHIIAQKGPFTKEQNIKALKQYTIATLITKDGGKEGGFFAKIDAAKECGVKAIVVKRPVVESGYNLEEIKKILKEG